MKYVAIFLTAGWGSCTVEADNKKDALAKLDRGEYQDLKLGEWDIDQVQTIEPEDKE